MALKIWHLENIISFFGFWDILKKLNFLIYNLIFSDINTRITTKDTSLQLFLKLFKLANQFLIPTFRFLQNHHQFFFKSGPDDFILDSESLFYSKFNDVWHLIFFNFGIGEKQIFSESIFAHSSYIVSVNREWLAYLKHSV